jgi:hypothetical protein
MISCFCPFCKHVIKAPDETAGTLIDCEQCKLEIRVPKPAAPPTVESTTAPTQPQPPHPWWKRFL